MLTWLLASFQSMTIAILGNSMDISRFYIFVSKGNTREYKLMWICKVVTIKSVQKWGYLPEFTLFNERVYQRTL